MGACREGCFHAHTPLHIHMITTHLLPPKHHASQRPGIPLFQRSVLPSHPRTTPRPPTTCIVYPHCASPSPLTSASLRTSLISSWQPIPRSEPAATYLCVCTASLLHQHRRMSLEAREVQRRQRVRANCGHPAGASAMKGPATRGGHSSLRLPGGDSACSACRDDDANQLGIRQHRLASQRRRGQRVR